MEHQTQSWMNSQNKIPSHVVSQNSTVQGATTHTPSYSSCDAGAFPQGGWQRPVYDARRALSPRVPFEHPPRVGDILSRPTVNPFWGEEHPIQTVEEFTEEEIAILESLNTEPTLHEDPFYHKLCTIRVSPQHVMVVGVMMYSIDEDDKANQYLPQSDKKRHKTDDYIDYLLDRQPDFVGFAWVYYQTIMKFPHPDWKQLMEDQWKEAQAIMVKHVECAKSEKQPSDCTCVEHGRVPTIYECVHLAADILDIHVLTLRHTNRSYHIYYNFIIDHLEKDPMGTLFIRMLKDPDAEPLNLPEPDAYGPIPEYRRTNKRLMDRPAWRNRVANTIKRYAKQFFEQFNSLRNSASDKFTETIFHAVLNRLDKANTAVNVFGADRLLGIIEDIIILIINLYNSDRAGQMAALLGYYKTLTKSESVISDVREGLWRRLQSWNADRDEQRPRLVKQGYLDTAEAMLDDFDKFRNAPMWDKLYKLAMYALISGVAGKVGLTFSSLGYNAFEESLLRKKYHHTSGDLISTLGRSLLYFCGAGAVVYKTGNVRAIYQSGGVYVTEYVEVGDLKHQMQMVIDGTSQLEYVSGLRDRVEEKIKKLDSLIANAKELSQTDCLPLINLREPLKHKLEEMVIRVNAVKTRRAPLAVEIFGDSGVGKSSIVLFLYKLFALNCRSTSIGPLNESDECLYKRESLEEFWSTYRESMWAIWLDDIAAFHPKALGEIDPGLKETLLLINNAPFITNQAELASKGKIPARPLFLVATTNNENLNAANYFCNDEAVLRRYKYVIEPLLKPEFTDPITGQLNPGGGPPRTDYWTFRIKQRNFKMVANQRVLQTQIVEFEGSLMDGVSVQVLERWFKTAVHNWDREQLNFKCAQQNILSMELCASCNQTTLNCLCMTAQGFFLSFGLGMLLMYVYLRADNIIAYASRYIMKQKCRSLRLQMINRVYARDTRTQLQKYGDVMREYHNLPIALISVGLALGASWKIYNSSQEIKKLTAQGQFYPKPRENERLNVWGPRNEVNTTFFSPTSSSNITKEQLLNRLRKAIAKVQFAERADGMQEVSVSHLFGVGGNYWLACEHTVPKTDSFYIQLSVGHEEGVGTRTNYNRISQSCVVRRPDLDLALIYIEKFIQVRSFENLMSDSLPREGSCLSLVLDSPGDTTNYVNDAPFYENTIINEDKKRLVGYDYRVAEGTFSGLCGTPVFADIGTQKVLLGIHSHGRTGTSYGFVTRVNKSVIMDMIEEHGKPMMSESNVIVEPRHEKPILETVPPSAVLCDYAEGTAAVRGTVIERVHSTSSVRPTMGAEFFKRHGITTTKCAPVMKGVRPQKKALSDMLHPLEVDEVILAECEKSFLMDILAKIPREVIQEMVHPYPQDVALNGFAGVAAVDGIPRSTSYGWPQNRSKRYSLRAGEPKPFADNPVEVVPETQAVVDEIERRYVNKELAHPVFTAALKDEPVSVKKFTEGATRIFCGAPFPWTIVVRKAYLSHIRLIFNYREVFECGVGLTAQSEEWERLYYHITSKGEDRMIAGDFKAFDKKMCASVIMAAFRILISLAKVSGNYDAKEILIMEGIARDTAFPTVNFFGTIITFFGSNPSGHPLTVIINSIVNSLYMRMVYRLIGEDLRNFQDDVALMTYGDDNIMSSLLDKFNHTAIQRELGRFGIEYTMADKEAVSVPFIHVSETQFLKRAFRKDDDIGHIVGPLDWESIEKMLCIGVRSKNVSEQIQYADVLRSAQQEIFFHGKAKFEKYTLLFEQCIHELGLRMFFEEQPLSTWEELLERYRKVSARSIPPVNHTGTLVCGPAGSKPKCD